jgi:plasmid stabilization system protein ParE
MAFRVEISPEAFRDLDLISDFIKEKSSPTVAEQWFNGIFAAIRSLSEMPMRCPIAEESTELETQVRLLLHGTRNRRYKIYFAIHDETKTVRIVHVRHWARKPVEADELADLMDETIEARLEEDNSEE